MINPEGDGLDPVVDTERVPPLSSSTRSATRCNTWIAKAMFVGLVILQRPSISPEKKTSTDSLVAENSTRADRSVAGGIDAQNVQVLAPN
ncbi:hypothetical protein VTL71DRAFT_8341, partial [Oculimacula yallundae]